ncbi:MAG: endonuclease/exonuclease/phosphatase family protein [Verrucomicrobiota bacterium]
MSTKLRFILPHAFFKTRAARCLTPVFCVFLALSLTAFAAPGEIVVASYNLENYLRMERREENQTVIAPKPEKEIQALIQIIKEINPDILGVCEMGSKDDFADFKSRLKSAGLGYTDFEYVEGADPERHLALASRFPIISRDSMPDVTFTANGIQEKVRRGFLDVTVKISPGFQLRLVGAHLKSKLAAPEGEELLRRSEAHLLRQHTEKIMSANPDTELLVYGDFNDTKNEPAIKEIMGPRKGPDHLFDLWLQDNVGDRWTHYWKFADNYERIDFMFLTGRLLSKVDHSKSYVYRSEHWNEASDHRPVVATFHGARVEK